MEEKVDSLEKNKEIGEKETDLIQLTNEMLDDARTSINTKEAMSVPIAELSTLGAGVASLIPALNQVTQTTTFATGGLYRLANESVGDALKMAKNGNYWGAFKTAEGKSKFVQLKEAGPLSATSTTSVPINPATMMMAVALFSIEKELGNISEMGKQILSFLEIEKESEIEADVETLTDIINKYKFNWDNGHYVASNHKLVLDIQRTARKNMNSYQKKVREFLDTKQFIVAQSKVNSMLSSLQKNFKYYRLSLYTFSMASFLEVMLSGNFKEEYITGKKAEIKEMSQAYRDIFSECSAKLEKMGNSSVEANVLKGIGSAGKAVGKFIGSIPLVKEGHVDEFLQEKGSHLQSNAVGMEQKAVKEFASVGNPGTAVFVNKLDEITRIYNHTSQRCMDKECIYLVTE